MKVRLLAPVLIALAAAAAAAWSQTPGFLPGHRVLMDAHNCHPYEGLWTDRVDRALSAGVPLGIEHDLMWDPAPTSGAPRIVVRHDGRAKGDDPTLEKHLFEKVRPLVEHALKEGNRGQWPLVTLNINDLRANDPEFFDDRMQVIAINDDGSILLWGGANSVFRLRPGERISGSLDEQHLVFEDISHLTDLFEIEVKKKEVDEMTSKLKQTL